MLQGPHSIRGLLGSLRGAGAAAAQQAHISSPGVMVGGMS